MEKAITIGLSYLLNNDALRYIWNDIIDLADFTTGDQLRSSVMIF
jgi:hypothetical protein